MRKIQNDKNGCNLWRRGQYDKFIYIAVVLMTGAVMFNYADQPAFWHDELLQLSVSYNDNSSFLEAFRNVMANCLAGNDLTPPLYGILAAAWIRIMPYGQNWLYLLNIILVGAGIYFIGIAASKVMNKVSGILSCLFAAGSCGMLLSTCYEFRTYALLFFSCALLLYTYVKRIENMGEEKLSDIILMGFAVLMTVYSHYHGAIFCFVLFLVDVSWFLMKKIKFQCIISYLIAGVLFLPWIVAAFLTETKAFAEQSWHMAPNLANIFNLYVTFLGDNKWFGLFLLSCFVLVIVALKKKKQTATNTILIVSSTAPVILMAFYGRFINPAGTGFMFRYFIGLFPSVFMILGIGVAQIIDCFKLWETAARNIMKNIVSVILCVGISIIILLPTYLQVSQDKAGGGLLQPFNELASYLLNEKDIHSSDRAIVFLYDVQLEGMKYFMTHKGELDSPNLLMYQDVLSDDGNYQKIYVSTMHVDFSESIKMEIEKEFFMTEYNELFGLYTYERQ